MIDMYRYLLTKVFVPLAIGCMATGSLYAQSVTYTLLGPPEADTALVQFAYNLPGGFSFTHWEVNGEVRLSNTITYPFGISATSDYPVLLLYRDSNSEPQVLEATIDVTAPLFSVMPDPELLERPASYKRVIRSYYNIENDVDELDGKRFHWTINGELEGISIDPGDLSSLLGDYPNFYYTFPSGGDYTIRLEVTNENAPGFRAVYEQVISITPTADRLTFGDLPNVLTPQDPYFVVPSCGTTRLEFKVFSRWGSMVYHQNSTVIRWDGRNYHGNILPEGIYYYIIDNPDGKYELAKGFFYVFK